MIKRSPLDQQIQSYYDFDFVLGLNLCFFGGKGMLMEWLGWLVVKMHISQSLVNIEFES